MSEDKKNKSLTKAELEELSFEDALARLETCVTTMESGNLPLEEMMKGFEEGQTLAAICAIKLKNVEKKIEILKKKTSGEPEWEDFNDTPAQTRNAPAAPQKTVAPTSSSGINDDDLLF